MMRRTLKVGLVSDRRRGGRLVDLLDQSQHTRFGPGRTRAISTQRPSHVARRTCGGWSCPEPRSAGLFDAGSIGSGLPRLEHLHRAGNGRRDYGALVVFGIASAFDSPVSAALLPAVTSEEQLQRGTALSTGAWQFAAIAGPAVGGLL